MLHKASAAQGRARSDCGTRLQAYVLGPLDQGCSQVVTESGEQITVDSPLLVRERQGKLVPMTGAFMSRMDRTYGPILKWGKATIHSRRRGFATAAVRSGLHMATISLAMRHSQGVTLQYITLTTADKAAITTRLAIDAYRVMH